MLRLKMFRNKQHPSYWVICSESAGRQGEQKKKNKTRFSYCTESRKTESMCIACFMITTRKVPKSYGPQPHDNASRYAISLSRAIANWLPETDNSARICPLSAIMASPRIDPFNFIGLRIISSLQLHRTCGYCTVLTHRLSFDVTQRFFLFLT
jgi:hypothetical protein